MSVGPGRLRSMALRYRLILLGILPLLVALAPLAGQLSGRAVDLEERAAALNAHVTRMLEGAGRFTDAALQAGTDEPLPSDAHGLSSRLEGIGIVDSEGFFERWTGVPSEPAFDLFQDGVPRWTIRADGSHRRLIVRAGPDERGRIAFASYVLDSTVAERGFAGLLPPRMRRNVSIDVRLVSSAEASDRMAAPQPPTSSDPESLAVQLRSPDGLRLGTAVLEAAPRQRIASRRAATARAWAVVLLLVLTILLFDWPRHLQQTRGSAWAVLAIIGGRVALLWTHVPARLLPHDLGSASYFGSTTAAGFLGSPADLLLTILALFLVSKVVACRLRKSPATPSTILALLWAAALILLAWRLTLSVAQNTRVPLLGQPELWRFGGPTLVAGALLLLLLSASEMLARAHALRLGAATPSKVTTMLVFILLGLASSMLLQQRNQQLALERLRSELAPQILEQSRRRALSLSSAVRQIQDTYRDDALPAELREAPADQLAYFLWVDSPLFQDGYKSSLDIYTPAGLVSHFGFDLPLLDDGVVVEPLPEDRLTTKDEFFTRGLSERALLHAEIPLWRDGELAGIAVGHVLDEPENVPFLPWSQPFLLALGPGPRHRLDEELPGGPQYVLYDEFGTLMLTTLSPPPPDSQSLRQAASSGETVRVRSAEEAYVGVALERQGQLHLLLVLDRSILERLASSARFVLLGLSIWILITFLPPLLRQGGLSSVIAGLRGSLNRKLLAALLVASVLPLLGLAFFLRNYIEGEVGAELDQAATRVVNAAQRVLEDYSAVGLDPAESTGERFNDELLYWLSRVVGQEIHVYRNGSLMASSKPELFESGLLPPRLDGQVHQRLVEQGRPYSVSPSRLGPVSIPVAYAPVRSADPHQNLVVGVLMVVEQRQIAREVGRITETILLATVMLTGLLAVAATRLARNVSRPVRELVGATERIAGGDYSTRLEPRTRDEVAGLVRGFNSMAEALAAQRADLERRRDYMETLLRNATTGVISIDPRGCIVTMNPAAGRLLGAVRGLGPGDHLIRALEGSPGVAPLAAALDTAPVGEPVDVDVDGRESPQRFRLVRVALPDPAGGTVGTLVLLDDVTDLMRSNQLAAWAEMARAIAHEIKNPLTPIQLSAEHLQRLLADHGVLPSEKIEACLETIIKQVRTLYDIAGEFSIYARLPGLATRPTDPVTFVRETLKPYLAAPPPSVSIVEEYEDAPLVAMDAKVFRRALVNLIENALQAMPDGGRLTVFAGATHHDEVVISVADSGVGLDPEVRRRLFEPYFSTKSAGTGLGLAIARRTVEAHQGRIEVDSPAGGGTVFRIHIPPLSTP